MIKIKKQNIVLALKVSLVVGTILGMINHFDMFLSCNFEIGRIIKMVVTYLVPFCVSLFSSSYQEK
ncbi:MAG: nitrate/nitrite transporter NrtS [Leptospiraceae bacterium]|nr:nitrate/nitrite transporter NrtS [Leptospiraceae bacterium]